MTLPTSGPISIGMVAAELGIPLPLSLGDPRVRALAGKPSGPISLSDLYGKSAAAFAGYIPDVQMEAGADPATSETVTAPVTANYNGGTGPFSHVWSHVSGSGSIDAVNSSRSTARMPNPRFSEPGTVTTQVVQCVVTDATGKTLTLQGTVTLTLT